MQAIQGNKKRAGFKPALQLTFSFSAPYPSSGIGCNYTLLREFSTAGRAKGRMDSLCLNAKSTKGQQAQLAKGNCRFPFWLPQVKLAPRRAHIPPLVVYLCTIRKRGGCVTAFQFRCPRHSVPPSFSALVR